MAFLTCCKLAIYVLWEYLNTPTQNSETNSEIHFEIVVESIKNLRGLSGLKNQKSYILLQIKKLQNYFGHLGHTPAGLNTPKKA